MTVQSASAGYTFGFWALMISLPVHITVVTSAMLAGMAFGLPLQWWYYFVAVPVYTGTGDADASACSTT